MLTGLAAGDLDTVLDSFEPGEETYVFVEGPRWTNRGGDSIYAGWRAYFASPIRLRSWRWADGPYVHESGQLAVVIGVVDCDFEVAGADRPLRMRMTWALRHREHTWRIVHEHGSQPLPDPYGTGDWLHPATP
jgi:ketosteroid isomerase-like protein